MTTRNSYDIIGYQLRMADDHPAVSIFGRHSRSPMVRAIDAPAPCYMYDVILWLRNGQKVIAKVRKGPSLFAPSHDDIIRAEEP